MIIVIRFLIILLRMTLVIIRIRIHFSQGSCSRSPQSHRPVAVDGQRRLCGGLQLAGHRVGGGLLVRNPPGRCESGLWPT